MKVSPLAGKPASSAMFVTVVKLVRLSIWSAALFIAGLLAILISLFSRWTSVGGAVLLMRPFRSFSAGAIKILTWGGLRGGISVALALYMVVVFSIGIQGLTLGRLVAKI